MRSDRRAVGDDTSGRRGTVDYALQRRARLADLFAGRVGVHEACDAHPYLLRAAKFHGRRTDQDCPVCRRDQLSEVQYVYGDQLKATAGQAKTPAELAEMAERLPEFSVYVVEVSLGCSWNHLTTSFVMGRSAARVPRRRQAATE